MNFGLECANADENWRANDAVNVLPNWSTRHKKMGVWVISGTKYLVFYRTTEASVSIEGVLDGRRDVKRIVKYGIEDPSSRKPNEPT